MSWYCIDCGADRGNERSGVCDCPGSRGYGSSSEWRDGAHEALARARDVVRHWREAADKNDEKDAAATANLPEGEARPIVTYVPASDALRLAADRLEEAIRNGEPTP